MHIISALKKILEKTFKIKIFRREPFGFDPISDALSIKKKIHIFFDVGANIGQTALAVRKQIPKSTIYCFEPFPETFTTLKDNTKSYKEILPIQLALGSKNTTISTSEQNEFDSSMNRLSKENCENSTIKINVKTLDDFCKDNSINKIDYMKIDTEGHELEVLKGSEATLKKQAIDFLEIEVGMNPLNQYHIPIEIIKKYLEERGYKLFGIYEQVHEWILKKPVLRRVNALFISDKLSDELTNTPLEK